MDEMTELLKICPLCGGHITRVEIVDAGGTRRISLCCDDAYLDIIDNWDVFSGLPANLRQVAIAKIKAEYAEMDRRSAENARGFKENYDKWMASHPELFHGVTCVTPMHD